MREHFYDVIVFNKKTNEEILSFHFKKDIESAVDLFHDLNDMLKASKALLVLYEDYSTSKERELMTNKK